MDALERDFASCGETMEREKIMVIGETLSVSSLHHESRPCTIFHEQGTPLSLW